MAAFCVLTCKRERERECTSTLISVLMMVLMPIWRSLGSWWTHLHLIISPKSHFHMPSHWNSGVQHVNFEETHSDPDQLHSYYNFFNLKRKTILQDWNFMTIFPVMGKEKVLEICYTAFSLYLKILYCIVTTKGKK